ncbi:uncharacterized protein LOC122570263 [Bombus pyrosoma]|uniref:uncharacterized protein LOC122570263 n=1 Tax=Bombus pyrosoma TaxID=396416 RepID=UPI001CB9AB16|nr:uncharacterized protein LOC122570263 [Bombus pyrosoma]
MYGAPWWAVAVDLENNRKTLKRALRTALCITTTAYRTVSHAALCMLTGNLPTYIKVRIRKESYDITRIIKSSVVDSETCHGSSTLKEELDVIGKKAYKDWQSEWDNYNVTKKLIQKASIFANKRMDIDHSTMQLLTRRGIFNVYRKRIGKEVDTKCWD